jgi:hypothetical protein
MPISPENMRLTKIGKILMFLKIYYSPIFVVIICGTLLGLAFVPGRLEYRIMQLLVWTPAFFVESLPYTIMLVFGSFSYGIYRLLWKRQDPQHLINLPNIISLSIIINTSLLLYFNIPTRLCFHTYQQQFERTVKEQQPFDNDLRTNIDKIGDIGIHYTYVEQSTETDSQEQHIYFATNVTNAFGGKRLYGYGFAYLPYLPKKQKRGTILLYDDWYIFHSLEHIYRPFCLFGEM